MIADLGGSEREIFKKDYAPLQEEPGRGSVLVMFLVSVGLLYWGGSSIAYTLFCLTSLLTVMFATRCFTRTRRIKEIVSKIKGRRGTTQDEAEQRRTSRGGGSPTARDVAATLPEPPQPPSEPAQARPPGPLAPPEDWKTFQQWLKQAVRPKP